MTPESSAAQPGFGGALCGSESQARRLLDALPVAAYTCDRDGLITYFNRHAVEVWGRAPKLNDPVDRFCGSFKLFEVDGSPITHDACWMALALRTGEEYNEREIVIERDDGSRITTLAHANPVRDESGNLIAAVNILVDITARKQSDQALLALKDELASQLSDMRRLHVMSARLSTTLELQPILEESLRAAAAIENTDLGLLSVFDAEQNRLEIGASLGFEGEFLATVEHMPSEGGAYGTSFHERRRVIVKDTETDPIFAPYRDAARRAGFRAVHSTPLVTRGGQVVGVLSTHFRRPHRPSARTQHLTDLCARQAVDFIENARLYERLREADHRKDEFLAMLAHELRNPLAPICSSLHILRLSEDVNPAIEKVCEIIERQTGHLVRLVDDLLEVSRITCGKIELRTEPVALAAIIRSAVETSRPLIEEGRHQLAITVPHEPVTLEADPIRLAQVVANLLNNAAKYTPEGGQIWLVARREKDEAVISVRDNGVGISADMLPRVFEMFAQTDETLDRAQGGLGIGLTLAKNLVQLHGGRIEAASDGPGNGSQFTVRLPLSAGAPPPVAGPIAVQDGSIPLAARRILVVDDTRDSTFVLGRLLELIEQKVSTTDNAASAVEIARAERPDVVISDIGMPGMDGYELARRLRQEPGLEGLVLVALTGYGQAVDRKRAKEAGFDFHLVKPVSLDSLKSLLATLPSRRGEVAV